MTRTRSIREKVVSCFADRDIVICDRSKCSFRLFVM